MYNKKESTEDYLEHILMAQNEIGPVRAIDLAKFIGFSKPSVSIALKKLKNNGFVTIDVNTGIISLTSEGLAIAKDTLERHNLLTEIFTKLGVPYDIASNDACKVEHLLSEETYDAIKNHLKKK